MKFFGSLVLSISLAGPAMAQEDMFMQFDNFPNAATGITQIDPQFIINQDVFGKDPWNTTIDDVVGLMKQGGRVYYSGDMAVVLSDQYDPIIFSARPDGGVDASWYCWIVPVCTQAPPR